MKITGLKAMLNNRLQRERVYSQSAFWDAKAEGLKGKAISMWPNNHLNALYHTEQLNIINNIFPDVSGRHMLDVGCGTGRLSEYFASRGAEVHGIDFSAKSIEIARLKSRAGNPSYSVQSLFDVDEMGAYDIVVSWGCVAIACRNAEELLDALQRFMRALRPTGNLLMLEPIHKGFLHRVLDMNVRGFVQVIEAAGFHVIDVVHLHFWPMRLFLAFIPWPKPITSVGYHLGQKIMKTLFKNNAFGDYKAIYAKKE